MPLLIVFDHECISEETHLLKGVSLILPADMEGVTSEGSGPLPQVDLSVVYKRLRRDGFFKKGKGTNKSMQCTKAQFCLTGTPSIARHTLTLTGQASPTRPEKELKGTAFGVRPSRMTLQTGLVS